jgi:hypothetical protein
VSLSQQERVAPRKQHCRGLVICNHNEKRLGHLQYYSNHLGPNFLIGYLHISSLGQRLLSLAAVACDSLPNDECCLGRTRSEAQKGSQWYTQLLGVQAEKGQVYFFITR